MQSAFPTSPKKNLIRPFFTITPSTAFNLKQNLISKILAKRSPQTGSRKIEIFSWPFDTQTPEYLVRQKDRFSGPSMVVRRPVELPSDDVDRANSASGPSNPGQHQSRRTGEARRLLHSLFLFCLLFCCKPSLLLSILSSPLSIDNTAFLFSFFFCAYLDILFCDL